jgi:hypothetical protein
VFEQGKEDFVGKGWGEGRVGQVFESSGELGAVELPEPGNEGLPSWREVGFARKVRVGVGQLSTIFQEVKEESELVLVGRAGVGDLCPQITKVVVCSRRVVIPRRYGMLATSLGSRL